MTPQELKQHRIQLFRDCASWRKPERVPFLANIVTWKIIDSGYKFSEALHDYDIMGKCVTNFLDKYNVDVLTDTGVRDPMRIPEAIGESYYYVNDEAADNMGNKEGKANNVRVMRFAEVLLMYAEACAKTNDVTGASYALKLIRERAGLADKTFTQDQLMDQIEHQCLLEFFGEGHRFDDLKRWYTTNEIKTILKANDKQGADNFQERNRYYPIPTGELNNNSAMQQIDLWK